MNEPQSIREIPKEKLRRIDPLPESDIPFTHPLIP